MVLSYGIFVLADFFFRGAVQEHPRCGIQRAGIVPRLLVGIEWRWCLDPGHVGDEKSFDARRVRDDLYTLRDPVLDHATIKHADAGTFTARLTVTDGDGLTGTGTVTITVPGPTPKRRIIAILPDGALPEGFHTLTSITTESPGGAVTFTATDLVGPPDHAHVEAIGGMTARGVADTPEEAMVGLELGAYVTSLHVDESLTAFFPESLVINGDGTDAPEIFVIEQTIITDDFQLELLTSGPGEPPVVARVVQVSSLDYSPTSTSIDRSGTADTMGGIGVDLDALGLAGIRGVRLPGDDGSGGDADVDPVVIAGIPDRCNTPFADADGDGDVDQDDFAAFQLCITGNNPWAGAFDAADCICLDRDGDRDVDESDFADFEDCGTGPDVPWRQGWTPDCIP